LLPGVEVDDAQAANSQPDRASKKEALIVWSAVSETGTHALQKGLICRL
jgi:hypothetical protein